MAKARILLRTTTGSIISFTVEHVDIAMCEGLVVGASDGYIILEECQGLGVQWLPETKDLDLKTSHEIDEVDEACTHCWWYDKDFAFKSICQPSLGDSIGCMDYTDKSSGGNIHDGTY